RSKGRTLLVSSVSFNINAKSFVPRKWRLC
ncbi:MAG: hypothetical protein DRQ59_05775, partial [Gammaproteobacteria bacterium]